MYKLSKTAVLDYSLVRPPPPLQKFGHQKFESIYTFGLLRRQSPLIVVVHERLEVSINVTIMISTIWMVHELPFYVNIQTFFTQTFLDKDL